jgi:hypothetical protein
MTFLEICQRLRLEAGISGSGPITVINQVGELEKVVKWVLSAYESVQNKYATWKFLQTSFSFPTIIDTQAYTPASVSLDELATWKFDKENDLTIYSSVSDEQYLTYVPWDDFQGAYMFGSARTESERPSVVTIKPDNSMLLWPIPNEIYTVTGEYFKKAQAMTENTDTPIIPSQHHMIIVWRALMYYGAFAAATEKYAHGQNEHRKILRKMENTLLPDLLYGEPLV